MADQLTRRTTLAGAAGLTASLPLLAACGGGSGSGASGQDKVTRNKPGTVVGPTSDVPVGSGKIYGDLNVVVTQPEAGTFKAFSATCTHQGCQVSSVDHQAILCRCHFSKFSIENGSVEGGPAPAPLQSVPITVTNGQITLA
ncbi:Rieske (2Fe-2S) protein [Nocardioides panacihumi]|uniref:Cytochrome bc1 complex Rieske iron-sulfur subunit n=1 Tax=Nocardioides panacihumi TaxID=400774 RepID=A0ABP5DDQ5_9ACTN